MLARHPWRADDAGPQAREAPRILCDQDARLSALHRGVYGFGPARDEASRASPSASCSRPLVVAEGGLPKPPGRRLRATPAGRRIPLRTGRGEDRHREQLDKRNRSSVPAIVRLRWIEAVTRQRARDIGGASYLRESSKVCFQALYLVLGCSGDGGVRVVGHRSGVRGPIKCVRKEVPFGLAALRASHTRTKGCSFEASQCAGVRMPAS